MHRQILQPGVDDQAEAQSEDAEQNPDQQQLVPINRIVEKPDRGEIGKLQVGLTAYLLRRLRPGSGPTGRQQGESNEQGLNKTASSGRNPSGADAHRKSSTDQNYLR